MDKRKFSTVRAFLWALAATTTVHFAATTARAAPDASPAGISAPAAPGASASPVPATTAPSEPKDIKEAVDLVGKGVKAAKEGKWWYMSSLACLLIMFVLSKLKVFSKIGRWKYAVLPALAIGSALLAAFQGGVSIDTALGVFTSSWVTGMVEEAFNHGILGKPHAT
jgi:hypothetical protein